MKPKIKNYFDAWLRLLRGVSLFIFDTFARPAKQPETMRTEAAIFCLHGLGDLLLAGHAVAGLAAQARSRGLKAVLFVQPMCVEFAAHSFDVDAVEGIDRHLLTRDFSYRAATLKKVTGRFAVAWQPTYNRMLRVEDALMRATGATERIGSMGHAPFILPLERKLGDRVYTRLIPAKPAPMHELERHAEFMAGIGIAATTQPWMISKQDFLVNALPPFQRDYLVVSCSASDARRTWAADNFLRASREISSRHQLAVVLIGDEKKQDAAVWGETSVPELIDLRGKTSACDLIPILAGARLVVSNDSGIYHLGVSLGRPALAVGGSGLPVRYFPYPQEAALRTKVLFQPVPCAGCNWRCIHTKTRTETAWCIQQIAPLDLVAAAGQILEPVNRS